MKKAGYSISSFILAVLFIFLSSTQNFAAEISPPQNFSSDQEINIIISQEEKAIVAGEILTNIISLILDKYTGSEVTAENLYEGAIQGMMNHLDQYSDYFSIEDLQNFEQTLSGSVYGIGIRLEQNSNGSPTIAMVLKDSPAEKSGLKKGDMILQVGNKDVKNLSVEKVIAMITTSDDKRVLLKIQSGSTMRDIFIKKEILQISTVYTEKFEDILSTAKDQDNKNLSYIFINTVGENTAAEFKEAIENLQKDGVNRIALDLRGNPGGYMEVIIDLCRSIVPKGPILYTVDKADTRVAISSNLEKPPFEKIIVLTDRNTASAAEVLASALQDANAAIIIGEKTYGKGVIQSLYRLPTGDAIKFTTEEYLRRNGKSLNNVGVSPNIIITQSDLIADRPLQMAYDLLKQK